jgi:hypothetical protein
MNFDNFLFAIIIAGIGLAGAYLKAEYTLHKRLKSAERRKELVLHDLHVARVRLEQNGVRVYVRIALPPLQPHFDRTIGFLVRHWRSEREHRVN